MPGKLYNQAVKRLFLAVLCVCSAARGASPELRGTWITTTGYTTGDVRTQAVTNSNFARLRAVGLNTVYMDAWRNGYTYFPSTTVQAITGSAKAPEIGTRDLFGDTLIQSHRNGMAQFAWLQYGFASEFTNGTNTTANALSSYMKTRGWLLKDSAGNIANTTNKYAWMNPLVPEVRKLIIDMSVEMVKKYDLDGIEFDDRLAWPTQFGYDDYTRNAYLAETGLALPTNSSDTAFTRWRADKITAFGQEFSSAIRAANANVHIGAAPGGYSNTYATYAVDAAAWSRSTTTVNGVTKPTFDEITPQIYSSSASNFSGVWNQNLAALNPALRGTYGVGISINNSAGAPYDWATINKPQVDTERSTNTAGHIWWYSNGVLADEAQLTAYYNVAGTGQAERTDRPAGWRPPSVVAAANGAGNWNVTLTGAPERYQIIGRTGADAWSIALNTVLPAGTQTLNTGGSYAAVEVLVDRRGFLYGDANFDQQVDFADLVILAQNYSLGGKLWTQGDFSLDGVVNFSDLVILAQQYGMGVPAGTPLMSFASALAMVPEPTTVCFASPRGDGASTKQKTLFSAVGEEGIEWNRLMSERQSATTATQQNARTAEGGDRRRLWCDRERHVIQIHRAGVQGAGVREGLDGIDDASAVNAGRNNRRHRERSVRARRDGVLVRRSAGTVDARAPFDADFGNEVEHAARRLVVTAPGHALTCDQTRDFLEGAGEVVLRSGDGHVEVQLAGARLYGGITRTGRSAGVAAAEGFPRTDKRSAVVGNGLFEAGICKKIGRGRSRRTNE